MRKLILLPLLAALAACNSLTDFEDDICYKATDRLPNQPQEYSNCRQDVAKARNEAWDRAAQTYRNKPR